MTRRTTNLTTLINKNPTRSEVFGMFNKARKAGRSGKLDSKKVNRALGILLSEGELDRINSTYSPTTKTCGCPDHKIRGNVCKHMIAKMMIFRINENRTN